MIPLGAKWHGFSTFTVTNHYGVWDTLGGMWPWLWQPSAAKLLPAEGYLRASLPSARATSPSWEGDLGNTSQCPSHTARAPSALGDMCAYCWRRKPRGYWEQWVRGKARIFKPPEEKTLMLMWFVLLLRDGFLILLRGWLLLSCGEEKWPQQTFWLCQREAVTLSHLHNSSL